MLGWQCGVAHLRSSGERDTANRTTPDYRADESAGARCCAVYRRDRLYLRVRYRVRVAATAPEVAARPAGGAVRGGRLQTQPAAGFLPPRPDGPPASARALRA